MNKLEYLIRVKDGKVQQYLSKKLFEEIATLKDGSYWLRVTPSNKRSDKQNRYMHSLFTIFSKELIDYTGDKTITMEAIKDVAKDKFLKVDVLNIETGEVIGQRTKHTSELTKTEMVVFVDEVAQWASEQFGIYLPPPDTEFEIDLDFDRK